MGSVVAETCEKTTDEKSADIELVCPKCGVRHVRNRMLHRSLRESLLRSKKLFNSTAVRRPPKLGMCETCLDSAVDRSFRDYFKSGTSRVDYLARVRAMRENANWGQNPIIVCPKCGETCGGLCAFAGK